MVTRTLLGPLTETWAPPASCTLAWLGDADAGTAPGWLAQDCHPVGGFTNEDDTACWPPRTAGAYTPSPSPRVWANGWGFYSPGLACPSGYSTACSATASGASDFSMQFPLTSGETAIGCCPSGYTCTYTGVSQTCVATVTDGTIPVGTCSGLQPVQSTLGHLPDSYVQGTASTRINALVLSAPLFQIHFRQSDLPASSNATAESTAAATTTSQPVAGATVTVVATSSSSAGLSTAAQAGIGAAVGVVGLAIITAVFFLFRRRWRERTPPMQHSYQEHGRLSPNTPSHMTDRAQSSAVTSELDTHKSVSELAASRWPTELPGNGRIPTGRSFYRELPVDTSKFIMSGH